MAATANLDTIYDKATWYLATNLPIPAKITAVAREE
jgi:hypothetical protein